MNRYQSEASDAANRDVEGLRLEPDEDFVFTPYLEEICSRALAYLEAGYPVHFSGPAGTGKTTLAFFVASKLGRPVMLLHGNDDAGGSDLVGSESGYHRRRVIDNYIHSVIKTEEELQRAWSESRLTTACKTGATVVYDEFTRSRAEANNVLLSVLEERILSLGRNKRGRSGLVDVHADFRAIFTSNPEEYAGVHPMADALMDRLITIRVDVADQETETAIAQVKSGLSREDVEVVVSVVRALRARRTAKDRPSLRASVMIARILAHRKARARHDDSIFVATCRDVLGARGADDVDKVLRELAAPPGKGSREGHRGRARLGEEAVRP
jgi:nitric oxide reductase NorQ protein